MIWHWHAGEGVLVHVDHEKKTVSGFKAAIIRQWEFPNGAHWRINDREMAVILPRFQDQQHQPPRIQPASKATMAREIAMRHVPLK